MNMKIVSGNFLSTTYLITHLQNRLHKHLCSCVLFLKCPGGSVSENTNIWVSCSRHFLELFLQPPGNMSLWEYSRKMSGESTSHLPFWTFSITYLKTLCLCFRSCLGKHEVRSSLLFLATSHVNTQAVTNPTLCFSKTSRIWHCLIHHFLPLSALTACPPLMLSFHLPNIVLLFLLCSIPLSLHPSWLMYFSTLYSTHSFTFRRGWTWF